MKNLLLFFAILFCVNTYSQFNGSIRTYDAATGIETLKWQVNGTPVANLERLKSDSLRELLYKRLRMPMASDSAGTEMPVNILWANSTGWLKSTPWHYIGDTLANRQRMLDSFNAHLSKINAKASTTTLNDSMAAASARFQAKGDYVKAIDTVHKWKGIDYAPDLSSYATLALTISTARALDSFVAIRNFTNTRASQSALTDSVLAVRLLANSKDPSITNELQTLSISGSSLSISSGNSVTIPISTDYANTALTSGSTGIATFYLTNDKTSTGTALYSTVTAVFPIINDANNNYTYGWAYNSTTKALTVTSKVSSGLYISLLSLTLLGAPTLVPANTSVTVFVKGN